MTYSARDDGSSSPSASCDICAILGKPCKRHDSGEPLPVRGWAAIRVPIEGADPDGFRDRLAEAIMALLPYAFAEQVQLSDTEINAKAQFYAGVLASRGDVLQYADGLKIKRRGELDILAEAFACLARTEGGLSYLGVHACIAPHDDCPADEGAAR
jgi:hypothetical protein